MADAQYYGAMEGLNSMNDGEHYTVLEGSGRIVQYSYATGEETGVIFDLSGVTDTPVTEIDDYEFSPDENLILLTTGMERIYRRSFRADYYIWDRNREQLSRLSDRGKQQLAGIAPDNGHVAFVRDNNLYVKDLGNGDEHQVTTDGTRNKIINGAPDWVYEEEFGFSKGYAWSPDGSRIAYYRFDESRVRLFNMTDYGDLYPEWYSFKYPKAGEENSRVSLHVYSLSDNRTTGIGIPDTADGYIPRIEWTMDPAQLSFLWMNRHQDQLKLYLADASNGHSRAILTEEETEFISEPTDDKVTFLKDGKRFLYFSEMDGYNHLYLYDLSGKLLNKVTPGEWDVSEFLGCDEDHGRVYYTSHEESPLNRSVYRIGLNGKGKKKVSLRKGWNTAFFSKGFRYYIHFHSSATEPQVITLHEIGGKEIREVRNAERMKESLTARGIGTKEFLKVPTIDGTLLNAYMIKPVDFDPDKTYPLFMFVYGGPQSQNVRDDWDYYQWFVDLVARGYIVACVDNRGTDGRGEAFRKSTYMKLGELETVDQVASARYLGSLPYIDAARIGIYGWSYGGYMASLCMTRGDGVFSTGIAVAPVTNWKYYDTIYTERFLRTPKENPSGYEDNSPLNYAGDLKGRFLLVHGMEDDNVHFQNSVDFAHALIEAGIQFDMMYYPNQNHAIRGGNSRQHLYAKLKDFVQENL